MSATRSTTASVTASRPVRSSAPAATTTAHGDADVAQRARAIATFDTRQQTAYGTLRTYLIDRLHAGHRRAARRRPSAPAVYTNRALHPDRGLHLRQGDVVLRLRLDRGGGLQRRLRDHAPTPATRGQIVGSLHRSVRQRRVGARSASSRAARNNTVNCDTRRASRRRHCRYIRWLPTTSRRRSRAGAASLPDIVGNLRIDQAWGSAQVMGAVHDVSAGYYGVRRWRLALGYEQRSS